jgi:hypothetical protein
MIGLFTDPIDTQFIDFVRGATSKAAPDEEFRIFDIAKRPDSRALEAREWLNVILGLRACIIDADQMPAVAYAAEFGSLAAGMSYGIGEWGRDREAVSALDRRILLVTRTPKEDHADLYYFGNYYSILFLAEDEVATHFKAITDWTRDVLDRSTPKVFVSYRSSQRDFARKVSESLRRRGAFVWFDEISIRPGDSIPAVINRGLGWCTHLILLVDETFFDSEWTKAEYESILYRQLSGRSDRGAPRAVIPLFLVDPTSDELPPMLRRIRGIDCRNTHLRIVMNRLWNAVISVGPR